MVCLKYLCGAPKYKTYIERIIMAAKGMIMGLTKSSCNCCANNSTLFCSSNSTHAKFTKNNGFGIHYLALTSKPILNLGIPNVF